MNLVIRSLMILTLALLAVACTKGTDDLRDWVSDVRQREPEPIDPIPPIQTPEVVAYEGEGLRDPFRGVGGRDEQDEQLAGEGGGLRPDPDRRKEYLEEFPLDTLSMVGTIEMDDVEYALIRDNESVVHRVREGNYMGQNHGLVTAVEPNQVEVRELVQDGRGGWVERRVRVAMAED
ncbi:pilus assembly protein PilP [Wenzhouxiangella sp. XN201]|uniref:pilus assembly protein PilP n=1 Tax=Wenzhouxiangella sp. XN201 TaxID=2710755 RepID=UPI0013C96E63|nr:pilus assembly protein PilP [Wenzhouxiangella sp. XN201]NEZ03045.1 pilus assembly protein PilP [Wenzhouxiangella sp. XN201]